MNPNVTHVLSIDVGVKNLTYSYISLYSEKEFYINKWEIIDVLSFGQSEIQQLCNNYNKMTKNQLKEAISKEHIIKDITTSEFKKLKKDYLKDIKKNYLKKKGLKTRKKDTNLSIDDLGIKVIEMLDQKFGKITETLDYVLIENQPCMKNPKMKSLQMIIMTYFLLKKMQLQKEAIVKCVPANLKMKYCIQRNYIVNKPKNYNDTKKTACLVVSKILENMSDLPIKELKEKTMYNIENIWKKSPKKDDLSDVVLQMLGFFYKKK